jgi:hypothetical protein
VPVSALGSLGTGTLSIYSFPAGQEVFVVPKAVVEDIMGVTKLTDSKYRVGQTPVSVDVAPGDYYVTVKHAPGDFLNDGADQVTQQLGQDAAGQATFTEVAREYKVTKDQNRPAIVTSLLRSKEQSLADFAAGLPKEELFRVPDVQGLADIFEQHNVPQEDWPALRSLLAGTGKAAWHGAQKTQYLYMYIRQLAPAELVVDPAARP